MRRSQVWMPWGPPSLVLKIKTSRLFLVVYPISISLIPNNTFIASCLNQTKPYCLPDISQSIRIISDIPLISYSTNKTMILDIFVDYIAVFRLNPVSCWFLDIFHYCMYPSYSQGFPVELPSQGAELFPSAVKISLPGHHPVELVVPRREFFWPWGGNQRQGGHWCGYLMYTLHQV